MTIAIVGAGLSGATAARLLADAGRDVMICDVRHHLAGNAYDFIDSTTGIRVHKYGPHLFHTKSRRVWEFVNRFAMFYSYEHRVVALLPDGRKVPFPPNDRTREVLDDLGLDPVDVFYRPYTRKMWGRLLEEVAPSIIKRVPARDGDEDRYFPTDDFQGLPVEGYDGMVRRMLDHPRIRIRLGVDFRYMSDDFEHVFNTSPIDVWHGLVHGPLRYRSIRFHRVDLPLPSYSRHVTINFTHDEKFTRVTEWKNLPGNSDVSRTETILTFEEPCDYDQNNLERYYPIADDENKSRHEKYRSISEQNVTHMGRCGSYAYLDMDQAINQAMQAVEKYLRRDE